MIVYHLTEKKWALENIENKRIKIAEIHDLNDPFELIGPDLRTKAERIKFRKWRSDMAKLYGLICFSRNWSNSVLWSHYGDKHQGIALGFEVSDELLMDIIYTSTRMSADSVGEAYGAHAEKYIQKILATKFTDWAYEDEVRVFTRLEERDQNTGKYFADLDDNIKLRKVVVGSLCDTELKVLENLCARYDEKIELIKARLAFRSYKVVKNEKGLGT